MSDCYSSNVKLTIFGESHGEAIGAVVEGICSGTPIDTDFINTQMQKRRAKGALSTKRTEADEICFLSGVHNGYATGTAITLIIKNTNTKSDDYKKTQNLLRPSHADYTAYKKYGGFQDIRGGGHFSGRLTAPFVGACSLFLYALEKKGIHIYTHIASCGGINDDIYTLGINSSQLNELNNMDFPVFNKEKVAEMQQKIMQAAAEGDSVGGTLETIITGIPAGIGEPFFDSIESTLARILFSIPALKGVEFGKGFAFADMRGSNANDPFCMNGEQIETSTNNNGGINGGISNGMPIVFKTVIKPTPSIYKTQNTVDFDTKQNSVLNIEGRHDPCILQRAHIVQTCAAALGIADLMQARFGLTWQEAAKWITD